MGIKVMVLICVIWYAGVSGLPIGRMDFEDKSVVPLNSVTNTKPKQLAKRSVAISTNFSQQQQTNQGFPWNQFSGKIIINGKTYSPQIRTGGFQSSSYSYSSSDGINTHKKQALTKTHSTSITDGTTHIMKTESFNETKENKNINGRKENTESIAEAKTLGVTNTNPDGSVKTVSTVVSKAAVSQTADDETKHQEIKTQALTKTHSTSIADGTTHIMKTESFNQTKENKNINGRKENTESIAEAKTLGVTNTNLDGSVKTVSTVVAKTAVSQTAEGETKHQEIKTHAMAETVKDTNGEERNKFKGAAQSERTKTNNGQSETNKTLAVGESEQITHADGKTEGFKKFIVLHPNTTIDNSNKDNPELKSFDTGKDNKKIESNKQGIKKGIYDNNENIKYIRPNDGIQKVSSSKEESSSNGMKDNIDTNHRADQTDNGKYKDLLIADDKKENVDDTDFTGKTKDATIDKVEKGNNTIVQRDDQDRTTKDENRMLRKWFIATFIMLSVK